MLKNKLIFFPLIISICSCSSINKVNGETFLKEYNKVVSNLKIKKYSKLKLNGKLRSNDQFGDITIESTDESYYNVLWEDKIKLTPTEDPLVNVAFGQINSQIQLVESAVNRFIKNAEEGTSQYQVVLYCGNYFKVETMSHYTNFEGFSELNWNKELLLTKLFVENTQNNNYMFYDLQCIWID